MTAVEVAVLAVAVVAVLEAAVDKAAVVDVEALASGLSSAALSLLRIFGATGLRGECELGTLGFEPDALDSEVSISVPSIFSAPGLRPEDFPFTADWPSFGTLPRRGDWPCTLVDIQIYPYRD